MCLPQSTKKRIKDHVNDRNLKIHLALRLMRRYLKALIRCKLLQYWTFVSQGYYMGRSAEEWVMSVLGSEREIPYYRLFRGTGYTSSEDDDEDDEEEEDNMFDSDTYFLLFLIINGAHCNDNQYYSKLYNLPILKHNKLIIPSKIAVVAFCLNPNGPGAKCLIQQSLKKGNVQLFVRHMDLTNMDSISNEVAFVTDLIEKNFDENGTYSETGCVKYRLHALVNNAARMVMAEYEWQTAKMIQQQFEVNVLGPIMLTAQLLPIFRKDKSRVINVISHCAYLPLPGVSLYGATKAAVRAWTIGSRVELEDHGIKMITLSPGSFFLHSSIMNSQQRMIDYNQMREHMSKEQLAYYGVYFDAYQNYLCSIDAYINHAENTIPSTNKVYCVMDNALWAAQPKAEYHVPEPWRYRIYFAIAWTLSAFGLHHFKDKAVRRFVATPQFQNYGRKDI